MIRHQPVERHHPPARRALGRMRRVGLDRGHPGNIEMDPRRSVLHETLQELRRGDRARSPPADVFHIGNLALEHVVIGLAQRHPPRALALGLGGAQELVADLVVIGKDPRLLMAEPDDDRPGQRRQIDHARRLVGLLRVPHHIRQNEPAFGIGVDHLHRVALHRGDHIAGPRRIARGHVFHQPDEPHDIGLRLAQRQRPHGARHDARAAHIHGHVFHARRRFEADPAGVEHHALADQGQRRRVLVAAHPFHHRHFRRAVRALPHRQKTAHAQRGKLVFLEDFHRQTKAFHLLDPLGEFRGGQVVGRLAHQIAGKEHALGHRQERRRRLARGLGVGHHHRQRAGGVLLGVAFVGVKRIGAQRDPLRQLRRTFELRRQRQHRIAPLELAERHPGLARRQRIGIALDAHHVERLGRHPRRIGQRLDLGLFHLFESAFVHQPHQRPFGEPVHPPRRLVHLAVTGQEHGHTALGLGDLVERYGAESDVNRGGHNASPLKICTRPNAAARP
ncbi:hypothetical protein ISM_17120 [Roseovarius nubinhibens ISM]|uniref:Uncharacterized protein n=1 Tax=Roseovarius nubinhibens (strain ATCC BAA-591 / DSM 15170 / ISM) TaxID=89187 RepID=A3SQ68_ROSNI|nr:hypothetical protein ISM_17120 [Roseovarius nubinhibens ISM]